ncbi:MAG TPA: type VI secretion system protein [Candidatus Angelobacter sp.]|nr:type VI secretion system protein [Candidatus Angelobacter sp.]
MSLTYTFISSSSAELIASAIIAATAFLLAFLLSQKETRKAESQKTSTAKQRILSPRQDENGSLNSSTTSANAVPRFLLLGAPGSGKSSLVNGLPGSSWTDSSWMTNLASGIARRHFDGGEILEISSSLFAPSANSPRAEEEWKNLVSHLRHQRPRRPVDGIILTVSATELAGDHKLACDNLRRQATQASKQLKQLVDQLGFSVPVYVVITKCDAISGYAAYVKNQLSSHVREIFGWSNPYSLDAPFEPQWTSEAFAEIQKVLADERLKYFGRGPASEPAVSDDLFLFPVRFQELLDPLSAYVEQLFHESGHRDGLQFRGIYFSGASTPATADFETIRAESDAHGADFTADLFEQKIFPERGLAHPIEPVLSHRTKYTTVMQALCIAAALLLFPGTVLGWHKLSTTSRTTVSQLQQIQTNLAENDSPTPTAAYAAIYSAQTLSGSNFQSAFLPASMVDSLPQDVDHVMPAVFTRLVYPGVESELDHRTQALLQNSPAPAASSPTVPTAPVAGSPTSATTTNANATDASQRLATFTDALLNIEDNIFLFNKLAPAGQGNGKDLLALADFLSPQTFSAIPRKDTSGLDRIVRASSGRAFDGQVHTKPAAERLQALVSDALQSLNEERLLTSLDALVNQINLLEQNKLDTYELLDGLRQSLGSVQTQLAAPEMQWIALGQERFQLPQPISGSLNRIYSRPWQRNILLCESPSCANLQELNSFVQQSALRQLVNIRKLLLTASTTTTGPLIAAKDAKLQLSPSAADLQTVLDNFLKLPFVAHEGTGELRDVTAGQQLFWDTARLQAAIQDKQAYDTFFSQQLSNTSAPLQDVFEDVALDRLDQNMVDAVASAQQFQPLPPGDLTLQPTITEIRGFQAASQSIAQVLDQFAELKFDDDYQDLLRVSTSHALLMLARLDRSFNDGHFYWPAGRNFNQWTRDSLPSVAGYGAHNTEEMAAYLVAERQDVQQYANAAQPLVAFLQQRIPRNSKQSALIAKWQSIVNDLTQYASSPGASGLGSLEDFLANSMDKIGPPDCQAPAPPASRLLYFVQVRQSLAQSLVVRCRLLSHQSGLALYNQVADFFNQRLAGKFPFAAASADPSAPEANPADVVELYRRLDSDGKSIRAGLQTVSGIPGATTARIATFLNQLDALRPLFSPLLTGLPGSAPAFDVAPTFRVNRNHEINGNQIIDWTLLVGSSRTQNSDPPATLHWTFGEPINLLLRWAKDSPQTPVAVPPATVTPQTRTVTFAYADPWSLLRMLAQHRPPAGDFDRSLDANPQTLVFAADQEPVPPSGKSKPAAQSSTNGPSTSKASTSKASITQPSQAVKVFIRLKLYAPGKTTPLEVPAFPMQAPTE